jgi:hypothetical protein
MMNSVKNKQPWIQGSVFDSLFILLPPFISLLVVWCLPDQFKSTGAMPVVAWCILILFVDVAHVYSTLYNTYFDKDRFARQKTLFILVPIFCYVAGLLLHLAGGIVFWRALAYVAVFHFVRQQYGFMRLYARADAQSKWQSAIDTFAISAATLYPLIYWHCTPSRNFNWFVNNDFITGRLDSVKSVSFIVYVIIIAAYISKELFSAFANGRINIPKNIIITGTFVSWYFGIVYFNGDMAFTLLNVVSHGIPYMALVWSGMKKKDRSQSKPLKRIYAISARWYGLLVFLGSLFLLAYIEEGLWDGFIWHEHLGVFSFFGSLPHISNDVLLALLVPLLSLPQSTHYILDGFIWRKRYA